jgi:hypothetical protein
MSVSSSVGHKEERERATFESDERGEQSRLGGLAGQEGGVDVASATRTSDQLGFYQADRVSHAHEQERVWVQCTASCSL